MGNCESANAGNVEDQERNKAINKQLIDERRQLDNEIKLLLLGAGESGKSTIAKQMKIIHLRGFTEAERNSYKTIIFNNLILSMRTLVQACTDLGITLSAEAESQAKILGCGDDFSGDVTNELSQAICALWTDAGIKEAYSRSAEFQLNDSAAYYFENIERVASAGYVPNESDILRSRAKTTGIIETDFKVDSTRFRMVDVGGQRSERKKWMHCFQDVTVVIFCVALSEYDLKLYEDDATNRMHESLKLFKEICNNKWFVDTHMILFLNKKDIFEKKIKKVDLSVCFPSYKGGSNFEKASQYIRDQFVHQNESERKKIYPHITTATDTSNIRHVFDAIRDIILAAAIAGSGLGL
eukprot:TRINITY_DN8702_c0_g1_i1.p1 TRINITY_DN8702_c0_g1~~TRINITY_DN8702_c0_g1_i1.p1  ORF type:complete len:354 (-),score=109.00 TRINITY_DN8702_c0_g1_i1:378-1439(-)